MSNRNNLNSNFLGILEGKRKAKVEEEKRKTAQLEAELKLKTAEVDSAAAKQAIESKTVDIDGNTKMYMILGAVLVLVIGLAAYFKFSKK